MSQAPTTMSLAPPVPERRPREALVRIVGPPPVSLTMGASMPGHRPPPMASPPTYVASPPPEAAAPSTPADPPTATTDTASAAGNRAQALTTEVILVGDNSDTELIDLDDPDFVPDYGGASGEIDPDNELRLALRSQDEREVLKLEAKLALVARNMSSSNTT